MTYKFPEDGFQNYLQKAVRKMLNGYKFLAFLYEKMVSNHKFIVISGTIQYMYFSKHHNGFNFLGTRICNFNFALQI